MKSILLLLALSYFSFTIAQVEQGIAPPIGELQMARIASEGLIRADVQGSPFIESELNDGVVILSDKSKFTDLNLRYNMYTGQMEYAKNGSYYVFPKEKYFSDFFIGKHHFVFKVLKVKERAVPKYLELLIADSVSLLKDYNIDLVEAKKLTPYGQEEPARFQTRRPAYYVYMESGELVKLKSERSLNQLNLDPNNQLKLDQLNVDIKDEEKLKSSIIELNNYLTLLEDSGSALFKE